MSKDQIAYPNLRAEMARKGVRIQDIARKMGVGRDTVGAKLSLKRKISLDEALIIADNFFPGQDLKYLFRTAAQVERSAAITPPDL